MKDVSFYVQGSASEPYRSRFWLEENSTDLHSACTCPAGRKGQYCKHRFQVIEGDITNIVDYNEEDMLTLQSMLLNSDVGDFYEVFMTAKLGEKIKVLINSFKFGWSEEKYDDDLCVYFTDYHEYTKEELIEKYGIIYKILTINEYYELMNYPLISIPNKDENHLFDLNKKYYGTYIGKVSVSKKTKIYRIATKTYTKSEELNTAYNYFLSIKIKDINQQMKELMR